MINLYVLSGIQGSGKTTLAKFLEKEYNAKILSYDEMHDKDSVFGTISGILANGEDVIFDALNLTRVQRISLLMNITVPCKKLLYVTTTPLEECLRRNSLREGVARIPECEITQCNKLFEPPTPEEGWDEIFYCYET